MGIETVVSDVSTKFFLPYQRKWIEDASLFKLAEKSRQIGWTFATAYRAVRTTALKGNPHDTWVSSRDDMQAQLFGNDCEHFAKVLHTAAGDLAYRVLDQEQKISAHILPFHNGKSINSLSSNPNAQAGKRGTRILDEFALHADPRKLYGIAYPGTMWGGTFEVFSTHRGSANYFNELINEIRHKGNPKKFSLHRVTLVDAVDQGLLEKLKEKWPKDDERQAWTRDEFLQDKRNGCPDEESWQQEFMCQPSDDNSAFLSYDLITSCQYKPEDFWEHVLEGIARAYIGVDIGRDHDLTVIWIVEKLGDVYYTRKVIEMAKTPFSEQEDTLYPLLALPNVRRCCIDQNGIGRQFTERAQERFGKYKVEGIKFTQQSKEEMAYPVRAAFEDKTVRIPDTDKIRADLRGIKKDTTASGNVRFSADRGKNGHSDRFWALALALHAGKLVGDFGAMVG